MMERRFLVRAFFSAISVLIAVSLVRGEDADPPTACPPSAEEKKPECPPPPNFGGDLCTRPTLTGNWLGARPTLAEHGITLDADVVNFYTGVSSGGFQQIYNYAGHSDAVLNVDFDKLIGWKGLSLKVRAEDHFGRSINQDTGALNAAYLLENVPPPDSRDVFLTDVLLTQMVGDRVGVFVGKMDLLNEPNAFAGGRGDTQFSNVAFLLDPAGAQILPYSCLGAGLFVLKDKEPIFTTMILNPIDTSGTIGIPDLFRDGALGFTVLRLPVKLGELPGHQLFAGAWTTQTFTAVNQSPFILLRSPPVSPIVPVHGSWALFWNMDQYFVVDPEDKTKGWGFFARAGLAKGTPNPLSAFYEAGIGGNSPIRGRGADNFGVGWWYAQGSGEVGILGGMPIKPSHDGQGAELYYNVAVTPWLHITPDFQWIQGGLPGAEPAWITGLRVKIDF